MSILKQLKEDIKNIVKKAGYEVENLAIETSNRKDLGDYQLNDAMQLAKTYHENPRAIAEKIVKELEKDNRFENINIAGPGFINITLSNDYIKEVLNKMNEDIFSNIDKANKKKIIIDFGGANVAKALHVGHLRSANLGEALKRVAKMMGHDVLGDAHLGDYGRPLGLVIKEIKDMYPELPYFDENYQGNYEELTLPITNEDLERIYPLASLKAKEDEDYLEEARIITNKFQDHEKGYYELWNKIVEISKEDIKKTYDMLNAYFEIWNGESDEMEYFDELVEILNKKGLLVESDGAQVIEVAEENETSPMPPLIIIKSNGSKSYDSTDLATILEREKNHQPDEIWYVVDARQGLHFEQEFRAARKAELTKKETVLDHIGFGTMNGKDGKPFKTRDGGVMTLKSLIELVKEETYKRLESNDMTPEEKESISTDVAIAAIKYADFLSFRLTDYVFEVEKFADLEGKTGPYLLYSTIRMKSLLNKCSDIKTESIKLINGETEKEIGLLLLELPSVLTKTLETKSMNDLAEYIYKLTSLYNKFYSENIIFTEENKELQESWIELTKLVYKVNMTILDLLSIKVPEKM